MSSVNRPLNRAIIEFFDAIQHHRACRSCWISKAMFMMKQAVWLDFLLVLLDACGEARQ